MGTIKLSEKEFDGIVQKAVARIPAEIRQHLTNIIITVRKRPSKRMREEMELSPEEPLLGLFEGVALIDRSVTTPPLYPDMIYLFQEPLEAMCETLNELEQEIEITVVHEVAHYIGMTEARLAELGYG
ncbi:MAG TPA: metallopeptidase family protein [Syntrophorhabdaceae bacterium]|nr:metallopeptidase family protein [Syntrophorhabdaceae bacterium]